MPWLTAVSFVCLKSKNPSELKTKQQWRKTTFKPTLIESTNWHKMEIDASNFNIEVEDMTSLMKLGLVHRRGRSWGRNKAGVARSDMDTCCARSTGPIPSIIFLQIPHKPHPPCIITNLFCCQLFCDVEDIEHDGLVVDCRWCGGWRCMGTDWDGCRLYMGWYSTDLSIPTSLHLQHVTAFITINVWVTEHHLLTVTALHNLWALFSV